MIATGPSTKASAGRSAAGRETSLVVAREANFISNAMEKEVKPGLFIGVVKKQQWHDRVSALTGEDRAHFIEKCNLFREVKNIALKKALGMTIYKLLYVCKHLDPEFDVNEDYYTVRLAPIKEGA